jgi:O-antigen ligase
MIKNKLIWIEKKQSYIIVGAMMLFFLLAPYSVSTIINKVLPVPTSVLVSFIVASMLFLVFLISRPKHLLGRDMILEKRLLLFSMFLLPVVSIFAAAYNLQVMASVEYVAYLKQSLPTRVINLSFFFIIFYVFNKKLTLLSSDKLLSIVGFYLLSIVIIDIFGIWQLLHFTTGIPMLILETRSFVHSVEEDVLFNFRLTSLVDEPSYLVPLIIDSLIIGLIIFKDRLFSYFIYIGIPGLIVLIFSFSVSGFANLALVILFSLVLLVTLRVKNKKRILLASIYSFIVIFVLAFFFRDYLLQFLMPIIGRFDTIFDIHKHSRLYQTVMPLFWLFDYSFINALFGFGPGSYEFLHMTKFLHYEVPISTTSNNMWIDLLFEYGIIGFTAFVFTYLYTMYRLFKRRNEHQYFLFSVILWAHLGITSIYRSDFASPRFWAIVMIVWIVYELGNRSVQKKEIS